MEGQSDNRRRLASLLNEVAVLEGTQRTLVEGVEVTRISKPVPRAPVVYQPKIRGVSSNGTENRRNGFQAVYLLHGRLA